MDNTSNMAVDLAPFGRWTQRDKAAQRRSPPRRGWRSGLLGGRCCAAASSAAALMVPRAPLAC